ncbi:hypothetical protein NDU88_003963 [Pleurodeles waltl]|uniref:Uncharacterized protein n=1 Tax=Pleurodeles waltl TaxID=8319 RepID=A0AAV7TR74_PLEWA|nr:hypothetical protein NDU88_003963 [Pleurodeles waltl]
MAAATGERAPAFTSEELEKLVDGVLPQYALLYGPPDQQVSTPGAHGMGYACVDWGGSSSGGGDLASEHEGAAGHKAPVGPGTDTEGTSDPEGEGSTTTGTAGESSDSDTSSDGNSLAVAATSVPPASTGTAATQRTSPALPAAPQSSLRARSPRKARVSFAPGTSAPAPVAPAALSAELIDLVRTLIVGQTTLLNAIQGVQREVQQSNAYLEGIHSGQAAHQRAFTALASALTAAIVPRTRKNKGRRARTDRAAPKEQCAATSPATPSRGGKGPRAPSKERKGSRSAEKVDPTCHIPAGKEDTKEARSPSPKGPETSRSEGD